MEVERQLTGPQGWSYFLGCASCTRKWQPVFVAGA